MNTILDYFQGFTDKALGEIIGVPGGHIRTAINGDKNRNPYNYLYRILLSRCEKYPIVLKGVTIFSDGIHLFTEEQVSEGETIEIEDEGGSYFHYPVTLIKDQIDRAEFEQWLDWLEKKEPNPKFEKYDPEIKGTGEPLKFTYEGKEYSGEEVMKLIEEQKKKK